MKSYTHKTGTIIGKGGTEIFFQSWSVPAPKGALVIAHGVGEHSGRYQNIIDELQGKGISIYIHDHRGHGKSGGGKGHVDSFMDYIYDQKLFIDYIREYLKKTPIILLGHSMGGVIATKYALSYPEDLAGLVLSSPGFVSALEAPKWKTSLALLLSKYIPTLTLSTGIEDSVISRDPAVIEERKNDALVHDKVSARWYSEFVHNAEECLNRALEIRLPLLIIHGTGDQLVDYHGSETFYQNVSSLQKQLHLFPDMYHETMNDIGFKEVTGIMARWITALFGKKKAPSRKKAGTKRAAGKKTAKAKTKAKPKVKKKAKAKAKAKTKKKAPVKRAAKSTPKKKIKAKTKKTKTKKK